MPDSGHTILENDRWWLESQDGMHPWDQGCEGILKMLREAIEINCGQVWKQPVRPSDEPALSRKLWQCWRYHWIYQSEVFTSPRLTRNELLDAFQRMQLQPGELLSTAARKAIEKLKAADRFQIWSDLRGRRRDYDLIVVQGVLWGDLRAKETLGTMMHNLHDADVYEDQRQELYGECLADSHKIMGEFRGFGDLVSYLNRALDNKVLASHKEASRKYHLDESLEPVSIEAADRDLKECIQFVMSKLPEALNSLDRGPAVHNSTVNFLLRLLDVSNLDIATGLGLSKSHTSRSYGETRKKVIAHLGNKFPQHTWCLDRALKPAKDPAEQTP